MRSESGLLSLPAEIRLLIWYFAVEDISVHVLEDGSTRCNGMATGTCSGPRNFLLNSALRTSRCTNCELGRLVGLSLTCRMIYHETNVKFRRDLLVSFDSTKAFWTFISKILDKNYSTAFSFERLIQVHIYIGPAKHADMITNHNTRGAIKILAEDAANLKILKLTLGYYLQAQTDTVLLNSKTLHTVLQFRNLDEIAIQMRKPPPGPVGISGEALSYGDVDLKIGCLEAVLRCCLCRRR